MQTEFYPDVVAKTFAQTYGRSPEILIRAPGRVNLLGAHIDTSEGWVLPAAIDRGIWLAVAPRSDRRVRLRAINLEPGDGELDLDALSPPGRGAAADWTDYPAGTAWALAELGHPLTGLDAVYGGDLPIGAGVSSSAAVEVAFALAWEELGGFRLVGVDRARLGRRVENAYVGVNSGIMDQFASIHGRVGYAVRLDCRSLEHELVPLPEGVEILLADSGVRRRLVGSGFNDRRAEAVSALDKLRVHLPALRTLRDLTPQQLDAHQDALSPAEARRARHVVEEQRRVEEGVAALRRGDAARFGELMRRSHESSRDLYEVSLPELDVLAEAAWETPGAIGARLAGGGFGGAVLVLVERGASDRTAAALEEAFRARFGRGTEILRCRTADGAAVVVDPPNASQ